MSWIRFLVQLSPVSVLSVHLSCAIFFCFMLPVFVFFLVFHSLIVLLYLSMSVFLYSLPVHLRFLCFFLYSPELGFVTSPSVACILIILFSALTTKLTLFF